MNASKFKSMNAKNASYFEFDAFEIVSDFVLRISSLLPDGSFTCFREYTVYCFTQLLDAIRLGDNAFEIVVRIIGHHCVVRITARNDCPNMRVYLKQFLHFLF